jgi:hypothetical protein
MNACFLFYDSIGSPTIVRYVGGLRKQIVRSTKISIKKKDDYKIFMRFLQSRMKKRLNIFEKKIKKYLQD